MGILSIIGYVIVAAVCICIGIGAVVEIFETIKDQINSK